MTNLLVLVTPLRAKWGQRADPLPPCDHLNQVASLVVANKDGDVTSTYCCRDCGEVIVRTYKSPNFSEMLPID